MLEKLGVGAIFFGAMLINAITGFAGNLLAMPGTIQLIGMTDAKVVSTIVGLFSCFIIAMMGIKNVIWHEVTKITLFMIPGIAIGFYLFYTLDLSFLLYIYGTVIVLIALKSFFTKQGLYKMSLPLLVFVMLCAGLMQGLFVSGGAFVVVYAVHTFKNKEEFRANYPDDDFLAVEMEAFGLFYIAKKLEREASCLMTVVDSFYDKRSLSSEERETSLNQMIELALDTAVL